MDIAVGAGESDEGPFSGPRTDSENEVDEPKPKPQTPKV